MNLTDPPDSFLLRVGIIGTWRMPGLFCGCLSPNFDPHGWIVSTFNEWIISLIRYITIVCVCVCKHVLYFLKILFCACNYFVCMYLCGSQAWLVLEESTGVPGTRTTGGCEPPRECWALKGIEPKSSGATINPVRFRNAVNHWAIFSVPDNYI